MKSYHVKLYLICLLLILASGIKYLPESTADVKINQNTTGDNTKGAVAVLNNDNFVVVWENANTVLAQTFDKSGTFIGTSFKIPKTSPNQHSNPYIANLGDKNRYVVAYQDTVLVAIKFKIFDNSGNIVKDETVANVTQNHYQNSDNWPKVAANKDGKFLMVWNISNGSWGWNSRARFYDADGNALSADLKINTGTTYDESQPIPCSLTNGDFVIVFHSNASGTQQVFYQLFDALGTAKTALKKANLNTAKNWIPHCKGLSNGGFVITYESFKSGQDIMFRLFNSAGNPVDTTNEYKANSSPSSSGLTWPVATALPFGFAIAYYKADLDAYFSVFDNAGKTVISEQKFHTLTKGTQTYPTMGTFSDDRFVVTWHGNDATVNNKYFQIFKFKSDCTNFQAYVNKVELNQIVFSSLPNSTVKIVTSPTAGTISNSSGSPLDTSTFYPLNNVYVKTTTSNSFEYINSDYDKKCKVDILTCYDSCKTCTEIGDPVTHKCASCLTGFYTHPLSSSQCIQSTDKVASYYFDNGLSKFLKCYSRCSECSTSGDDIANNCTKCSSEFLVHPVTTSQCISSTDSVKGYYYNTDSNAFVQCHPRCAECSIGGDDTTNNCTICDGKFKAHPVTSSQCVSSTDKVKGYYYDKDAVKFLKCYTRCSECSIGGNDTANNCTTCGEGFAAHPVNTSQCILSTAIVKGYYYDKDAVKFLKCYSRCTECAEKGDDTTHHCSICAKDYKTHVDFPGQCYLTTEVPGYYYSSKAKWEKCHDHCATCIAQGSDKDNNCKSCKGNFYSILEIPGQCFAANDKISGYYFSQGFHKCHKSCDSCETEGNDKDNKCLTCAAGFFDHPVTAHQCISSYADVAGYFFDEKKQKFGKCDVSCSTCKITADNCTACNIDKDYHPLEKDSSKCFPKDNPPDYFFLDTSAGVFKPCEGPCLKCSGKKDMYEHLCTKCKDGFFPVVAPSTNCYEVGKQPSGFYFDESVKIFNKCVDDCITCGVAENCVSCATGKSCSVSCKGVIFDKKCMEKCPDKTIYLNDTNTCLSCESNKQLYLKSENVESCVDSCPSGFIEIKSECVTCESMGKFYHNGECRADCPGGYRADKGFCITSK
jgi:hypothetical protein